MIQVALKKGDYKTRELRCEILAAMPGLLYLDSWKFRRSELPDLHTNSGQHKLRSPRE